MSDGKKFTKTDASLSPEERLAVVERNYSVILQRIQSYDQVLVEFANINSDLNAVKQSVQKIVDSVSVINTSIKEKIDALNSKTNDLRQAQSVFSNHVNDQKEFNSQISASVDASHNAMQNQIDNLNANSVFRENQYLVLNESLSNLEKILSGLNKSLLHKYVQLDAVDHDHKMLKDHVHTVTDALRSQMDTLVSSLQDMPQFNEWATKIYIRVCNEINDKQKAFYQELDKRSQQLKEQLASDPYTADSVRNILKNEMDALAMDGKNAYLKATNASQQIQLLEKKIENINLILKKYELNK